MKKLLVFILMITSLGFASASFFNADKNESLVSRAGIEIPQIYTAIYAGDANAVKKLLADTTVLSKRIYRDMEGAVIPGYTPLMFALYYNQHDIAELLIENGACVDDYTDNSQSTVPYKSENVHVFHIAAQSQEGFACYFHHYWKYTKRERGLSKKRSSRCQYMPISDLDAVRCRLTPYSKYDDIKIQMAILGCKNIFLFEKLLDMKRCSLQVLYMLAEKRSYQAFCEISVRLQQLHNDHEYMHFEAGPFSPIVSVLYYIDRAGLSDIERYILDMENIGVGHHILPPELKAYWISTCKKYYPIIQSNNVNPYSYYD